MSSLLSRSQIPPGGWQFVQPQTGWANPHPVNTTFDQTVDLIRKHRAANPALVLKHNLSTEFNAVAMELEAYTRTRLGMTDALSAPNLPGGTSGTQTRCCGG